jgi:cytochrome c oxidase subunit 4
MTAPDHHLAGDHGDPLEEHALEHAHPGARTYVIVGVILAVITAAEVFFYTQESVRAFLVPLLLVLSASKFVLVVGFYMHLRFDHPLFTGVFGFGLAVAGSIITALMFLFGQYPVPPHGG